MRKADVRDAMKDRSQYETWLSRVWNLDALPRFALDPRHVIALYMNPKLAPFTSINRRHMGLRLPALASRIEHRYTHVVCMFSDPLVDIHSRIL